MLALKESCPVPDVLLKRVFLRFSCRFGPKTAIIPDMVADIEKFLAEPAPGATTA